MGLPDIKTQLDALDAGLQQVRRDVDTLIQPVPPPSPTTLRVRPGDDINAALRSLDATGGVILASPGKYDGILRGFVRSGTRPIYLRSDTANLPPEGERITPEYEPDLAMFHATNNPEGVFVGPNKSSGIYFQGIGIGPCLWDRSMIALGGDQNAMKTRDDRPFDFLFDRVFFKGDPVKGQHNAIRLHGRDLTVVGCWFQDIFEYARDSQALAGFNGVEHIRIENCHIEGGAENIMFGGSDAASADMRPSTVVIRGNHILKNFAWMALGQQPTIKALFELKNLKQCTFEGNLLEFNWKRDWPDGVALVIKAANQGGTNPWANSEDILIQHNVVRNVGAFCTVVGKDDGPYDSDFCRRITVRNNVCLPLSQGNWQGTGRSFRMNNIGEDWTFDHNTIVDGRHSFLEMWRDSNVPKNGANFRFTNNVVTENDYGIFVSGGLGKAGLDLMLSPGYEFTGNAIRNDVIRNIPYPDGNGLVSPAQWAGSFDAHGRVLPGSPVDLATQGKTTDGQRVGADVDQIRAAMNDKL